MEEKSKQNRNYQDSVFVHLFTSDTNRLLTLCKALDSSIFSDSIELIKLENTLYTGIKNDVSCKIEDRLIFIIEHQSTINENMPLRCLEYIARIFDKIIASRTRYARRLIKIPTPEFYVFYTGNEKLPAVENLQLSKAFMKSIENPQLELIVKVINLNSKGNDKLLKECVVLGEYAQFVRIVKRFKAKYGKEGYDKAIRYCIRHGILGSYVEEHAKEIEGMLLAEYDYDMDIQVQREESYNEGVEVGIQRGMKRGKLEGMKRGKLEGMKRGKLEGIKEEKINIAYIMKKEGCPLSFIIKTTGLSVEEIERL